MSDSDAILNDFLAYMGGALLAVCLIPEIIIMINNRSAEDVSLAWSVMHIAGLIFTFAYLFRVQAKAGYLSLIPELALIVVVMITKLYLDHVNEREKKEEEAKEGDSDRSATSTAGNSVMLVGESRRPLNADEHTAAGYHQQHDLEAQEGSEDHHYHHDAMHEDSGSDKHKTSHSGSGTGGGKHATVPAAGGLFTRHSSRGGALLAHLQDHNASNASHHPPHPQHPHQHHSDDGIVPSTHTITNDHASTTRHDEIELVVQHQANAAEYHV